MSVHINEVEVEPRREEQPAPQPAGGGDQNAPNPELANKVAAAVALLHARDLRLVAD
jgi:hypothetical protein